MKKTPNQKGGYTLTDAVLDTATTLVPIGKLPLAVLRGAVYLRRAYRVYKLDKGIQTAKKIDAAVKARNLWEKLTNNELQAGLLEESADNRDLHILLTRYGMGAVQEIIFTNDLLISQNPNAGYPNVSALTIEEFNKELISIGLKLTGSYTVTSYCSEWRNRFVDAYVEHFGYGLQDAMALVIEKDAKNKYSETLSTGNKQFTESANSMLFMKEVITALSSPEEKADPQLTSDLLSHIMDLITNSTSSPIFRETAAEPPLKSSDFTFALWIRLTKRITVSFPPNYQKAGTPYPVPPLLAFASRPTYASMRRGKVTLLQLEDTVANEEKKGKR